MKARLLLAATCLTLFGAVPQSHADVVDVTYYSNFVENPGVGISFSSPFLSDSISGISELRDIGGADTDINWPSASVVFGSDFTTLIDVPVTGTYTFGFGTDDAGYLFIGGTLIGAQPGAHPFPGDLPYSTFLTAGVYSLEVQYDNMFCCGAVADLQLPGGVSFTSATPLPSAWGMMLIGFIGLGFTLYSRKRREVAIRMAAA